MFQFLSAIGFWQAISFLCSLGLCWYVLDTCAQVRADIKDRIGWTWDDEKKEWVFSKPDEA